MVVVGTEPDPTNRLSGRQHLLAEGILSSSPVAARWRPQCHHPLGERRRHQRRMDRLRHQFRTDRSGALQSRRTHRPLGHPAVQSRRGYQSPFL